MDEVVHGRGERAKPPLRARVRLTAVRLATRDPGLVALRRGARGALSFGLTVLAVQAISAATGQSIMNMALGFSVSMFGASIAREAEQRARVLSTLALFAAAGTSFCASALLHQAWLNHALFVALVFGVVYARRFGERANAAGYGAFTSFFLASFLAPPPSTLPWQLLGLALAALAVLAVQLVLLPQRPVASFERSRRVLDRRLWRVLGAIEAVDRDRSERAWSLFERELGVFEHTIDASRAQLDAIAVGSDARNAISYALFELETATERVARLAGRAWGKKVGPDAPRTERAPLSEAPSAEGLPLSRARGLASDELACLQRLRRDLQPREIGPTLPSELPAASGPLGDALGELRESYERLRAVQLTAPGGAPASLAAPAVTAASLPPPSLPPSPGPLETPPADSAVAEPPFAAPAPAARRLAIALQTRLAIQAGAACALAIAGGEWLSPQRWYWAVIAVWAMFSGTASRGDALYKSLERLLGTVLGVLAGMGLVALVGREPLALFSLMLLSIFATYYFFTDALVLMTFFLTVMLAVLFALLGHFSAELLWLRLEETAIGAGAGLLVAAVLLPRATPEHVRERFVAFTEALEVLVAASLERLARGQSGPLGEQTRAVERAEEALRLALRPWRLARFDVGASLHALISGELELCMRSLHELTASRRTRQAPLDAECRRALQHEQRLFEARLRYARQALEAEPPASNMCREPLVERAGRALERMAGALTRIAGALDRVSLRSPLLRF